MVVDAHAHVIVPALLRDAAPAEAWRPRVRREDGEQVVELEGRAIRAAVHEFVDVEAILDIEREASVDHVLLSPWVPLLFGDVESQEGLRRCRIQNEALAGLVESGRGSVSALGAVPLQDPELAAGELTELMAAGVLAGVEVAASVGGAYLGDGRFEPFWAAAEGSGAVVFVHPTTRGLGVEALEENYLWNTVGNPIETTIAAAHMTMAGVMERYPDLRVVLAHGGGALLALRGRLRHAARVGAGGGPRLEGDPDESLRRFHYDTVVHDPDLLRATIAYAGADQVVLGSDYPFDMGDPDPVGTVRALGLGREEERAVLGDNAARLLGLSRNGLTESAA